MNLEFPPQSFRKGLRYQIPRKVVQSEPKGQTDTHDEAKVPLRSFAKVPKQ